jgi:hypothetical protein
MGETGDHKDMEDDLLPKLARVASDMAPEARAFADSIGLPDARGTRSDLSRIGSTSAERNDER